MPDGTPLTQSRRPLVLAVSPVGLTELGARFRMDCAYTACRICGTVFQSDLDRKAKHTHDVLNATLLRREWSFKHAKQHPTWEHERLEKSGAYMTPEAANKLAAFGIISLSDMALDDEMWHAGFESARTPNTDAEG